MSEFIKIGILTVSDRASKGEYEDLGGPAILDVMSDFIEGEFQHDYRIVPARILTKYQSCQNTSNKYKNIQRVPKYAQRSLG